MTTLPPSLVRILSSEFGGAPAGLESVTGGDINRAVRWRGSDGRSRFVKYNPHLSADVFAAESSGLAALRKTNTLRVPEVLAHGAVAGIGFLALEWMETGRNQNWTAFGAGLARLHAQTAPRYGFERDNWIGSLPQANGWMESGLAFWAERRILPLVNMAAAKGLIDSATRSKFDRLRAGIDRSARFAHARARPSLLHGDLWSGNVLFDLQGQAVLIDPAVYYGDREVEIAFTELFGGFPPAFYEAYRADSPLDEGYEDRKPLWQLYPLLVHLNLFGRAYWPQVEQVLQACLR